MSKGERLEKKGKFRDAADWFKEHGQFYDVGRNFQKGKLDLNAVDCFLKVVNLN